MKYSQRFFCITLLIMIFGVAFAKPVSLTMSGPHIVANSYTLSGDGVLTNGETSDLSLTIENIGDMPTTSTISVTLTSSNTAITIIQGTAMYNGVEPNQLLTLENGFTISAASSVFNGQSFTIGVTAVCGNDSWESSIVVTVYRPIVELNHVAWTGNLVAGGNIDVMVFVENIGGVLATDIAGTLTTTTSNVNISNAEQQIGNLYPSGIATFVYHITLGLQVPFELNFNFNFTSENGINLSEEFSIANGCSVIFELHDTYGDGWNNAELQVSFSNGTPTQTMTVDDGSQEIFPIDIVSDVTVTVSFISGWYDSECSFEIYYQDGDMIYQSDNGPDAGVVTTFVTDCGIAPIECASISQLSSTVDENRVTLNWEETPSNSYQIRRDGVSIALVSNTTFTDFEVAAGEHYYCVYAICNGEILSAPLCEMVTIEAVCFPPENLTTTTDGNHVQLSWSASSTADSYRVYRDEELIATELRLTHYDDENVSIGTHCYTVSAVCDEGVESEMSNESCEEITLLKETQKNIQLFPNPATSHVTLKGVEIESVTVFSIVGQMLEQHTSIYASEWQWNCSNYENGMYWLQIKTVQGDQFQQRVVIAQ